MAYLSPQQVIGVQPQLSPAHMYHGRRSSFNPLESDESRINQRQNPLPIELNLSSHSSANPWAIPYSPPVNAINPHFPYQGLPQSRWIQEQNPLLSPEYRDSRLFSSQYQQLTTMQAFQQQQRDTQQKSELEREREARFQRDQETLAQCNRESIIHHEAHHRGSFHRDDMMEVQQGIHRQNSQQNFSPRETFNSDQHMHQSQLNREVFLNKDSMVIEPYLRQTSQVDTRTVNNPGSISDLSKQNVTNQSLIYYPEASVTNNDNFHWQSSASMSGQNAHQYSKSSLEDSFLNNIDTRALISSQYLNSQTLINNQMTIRENVHVNKHLEDIDLKIDQHISAIHMDQQNKVLDVRKPSIDQSQQSSMYMMPRFENVVDDQLIAQSDRLSKYTVQQNLINHESITSHDAVISFNPYINAPHERKSRNPEFLRNTNSMQKNGATVSSPNQTSFSQNNSVQATQNSAVNINININMPNHAAFPYGFSQQQALQSREPAILNSKPSNFPGTEDDEVCFEIETSQPTSKPAKVRNKVSSSIQQRIPNQKKSSPKLITSSQTSSAKCMETVVASKEKDSHLHSSVKASAPTHKQGSFSQQISDVSAMLQNESNSLVEHKPKMKFSSIECLLGMTSKTVSKSVEANAMAVNESSLELARSAMEKKERISVIKPLLVENQYPYEKKNEVYNSLESQNLFSKDVFPNDVHNQKNPIKPTLNTFVNIPKSPPTSPVVPSSPKGNKPVHPSIRLQKNTSTVKSPTPNDSSKSLETSFCESIEKLSNSHQSNKPIIHPVPGGKPASYSMSFPDRRISGKPLSYLQSVNQMKKSNDSILTTSKASNTTEVLRKDVLITTKAKKMPLKPPMPLKKEISVKATTEAPKQLAKPSSIDMSKKVIPSGKPYAQLKDMVFEDNAEVSGSMSSSSDEGKTVFRYYVHHFLLLLSIRFVK